MNKKNTVKPSAARRPALLAKLKALSAAKPSQMPTINKPMLATLVDRPFNDPQWLFETKWDGVRALCYVKELQLRLVTRNGKEVAFRYPELAGIAAALSAREAVLDGEIVTLDARGNSVFQWLQSRIGLKGVADIAQEAREHPATYYAFDLLYCDGYDLRHTPLSERKKLLADILRPSARLRLSAHVVGKGEQRFHQVAQQHLEGIIAKHAASPYQEGRSKYWLKIKTVLRQEVVIAGYTAPRGSRALFGALVVGLYEGRQLRYVGHVGGGFDSQSLQQVYDQLQPLRTARAAFADPPATNEPVQWLKPRLVCEVKFAEWTAAGLMRQPIFTGLRDDKRPEECRVEQAHNAEAEHRVVNRIEGRKPPIKQTQAKQTQEADMSLKTYWRKRDFQQTAEPKGQVAKKRAQTIFVIHEHHASILHFDLRLEIDGVLKSWSVPKGPTLDPKIKRLAVEVEDHPLAYANFNGTIAEGQYGAGRSLIWDKGQLEVNEPDPLRALADGRLSFTLTGKKLHGDFALVRMKGRQGKPQWLLMKKKDEHAESNWQLELIEPDERFKPETPGPRTKSTSAAAKSKAASGAKQRARRKVNEPESSVTLSAAAFLKRERLAGDLGVKIGQHTVALTNLDKLYWPKEKISKGELIRYYLRFGKTLLPYLKDRPAILKRYPNGIEGQSFFQHDVTAAPEYIKTEQLTNEQGRLLNYAIYTDLASLIYLVNLGTIGQHPWLSRVNDLEHPDYVVFDLDPKGAPFGNVLKVARLMKQVLDELEVTGFVKTSGSSGIHIFIPIKRSYTFEQTMDWAELVAKEVAARNPKIATIERRLAAREKAQVYVDWQQNARGKSIAAVYTVRPKPKATVSAPVSWAEIEAGFKLTDFTLETMSERLRDIGDLWAGLARTRQRLPAVK
jgi:DNA ligase D-like protein (predicted ligase)/DNA ligase D-like protein (predicted polymerase)/DNA ligase D-like protein (predicted 3'-phosphoesterase)